MAGGGRVGRNACDSRIAGARRVSSPQRSANAPPAANRVELRPSDGRKPTRSCRVASGERQRASERTSRARAGTSVSSRCGAEAQLTLVGGCGALALVRPGACNSHPTGGRELADVRSEPMRTTARAGRGETSLPLTGCRKRSATVRRTVGGCEGGIAGAARDPTGAITRAPSHHQPPKTPTPQTPSAPPPSNRERGARGFAAAPDPRKGPAPRPYTAADAAVAVAFSSASSPSRAVTSTTSPSANRLSMIARASGSTRCFWMTRFSGRAPYVGS